MIKLPPLSRLSKLTSSLKILVLAAMLVFVLGATITVFTWRYQSGLVNYSENMTLTEDVTHFNSTINYKLNTDSDLLQVYADLFIVDSQNNSGWNKVSQDIDIKNRYRGTKEIGFIQNVAPGDLSVFVNFLGAGGATGIYPSGSRAEYTP
jgi:CHASE1-domain containing sensor protein